MISFSMNGKSYETDIETLGVLTSVVRAYRAAGSLDPSAIAAMMWAGLKTGRIKELTSCRAAPAADDSAA